MRKSDHIVGFNFINRRVLAAVTLLCCVVLGNAASAQEIKPRILILFDTSGSMARDIGVYDPALGYNQANSTNGDGSGDVFDTSYQCCEGAGGSRMFIAKEAMREMILATGDIEFALMKFPQRYVEDLGPSARQNTTNTTREPPNSSTSCATIFPKPMRCLFQQRNAIFQPISVRQTNRIGYAKALAQAVRWRSLTG